MDRWLAGWLAGWLVDGCGWMGMDGDGWGWMGIDGWMDACIHGWMEGSMNGWVCVCTYVCIMHGCMYVCKNMCGNKQRHGNCAQAGAVALAQSIPGAELSAIDNYTSLYPRKTRSALRILSATFAEDGSGKQNWAIGVESLGWRVAVLVSSCAMSRSQAFHGRWGCFAMMHAALG